MQANFVNDLLRIVCMLVFALGASGAAADELAAERIRDRGQAGTSSGRLACGRTHREDHEDAVHSATIVS